MHVKHGLIWPLVSYFNSATFAQFFAQQEIVHMQCLSWEYFVLDSLIIHDFFLDLVVLISL